jgi:hypothetical protein
MRDHEALPQVADPTAREAASKQAFDKRMTNTITNLRPKIDTLIGKLGFSIRRESALEDDICKPNDEDAVLTERFAEVQKACVEYNRLVVRLKGATRTLPGRI